MTHSFKCKFSIVSSFLFLFACQFISQAQPAQYRLDDIGYNSGNKQTQTIGQVTLSTGLENDYYLPHNRGGHFYAEVKTDNINQYQRENYDRSPLNLALVIDRSGSMSGEKLKNAKQAAKYLVDQMTSDDYLSIVIYDTKVDLLHATARVTNKQLIKNKISEIIDRGGTNLMGGALKGYEQVKQSYKAGYINRVLLLSDGQANEGITNPNEIDRIVRNKSAEQGITISTFGLGNDYNEDLMTAMAESGNGNYYFISNANTIASIFEKELNGLSNAIAQQAQLKIILPDNVHVQKVYGYRYTQAGQVLTIHMNTLFADETRGVLVKYSGSNYVITSMQFTTSLTFTTSEKGRSQRMTLYNPCQYTTNQRLFNTSYNEWVSAQVALYESNDQLEIAMKESDKGNYEEARKIVQKNKVYMQSKAPLVKKSVELQKAESANENYDSSLRDIESKTESEVKYLQKSSKADNYGIRNKKK